MKASTNQIKFAELCANAGKAKKKWGEWVKKKKKKKTNGKDKLKEKCVDFLFSRVICKMATDFFSLLSFPLRLFLTKCKIFFDSVIANAAFGILPLTKEMPVWVWVGSNRLTLPLSLGGNFFCHQIQSPHTSTHIRFLWTFFPTIAPNVSQHEIDKSVFFFSLFHTRAQY